MGRVRRLQAAPDPTCAPFEPARCDVFISEATFALPVTAGRTPPRSSRRSCAGGWTNRERGVASVLFCYALGKAQRVLAELTAVHRRARLPARRRGAPDRAYRQRGVAMLPTLPATAEKQDGLRGRADHRAAERRRHAVDAALRRAFQRLLLGLDAGARRPAPPRLRPRLRDLGSRGLAGAARHLLRDSGAKRMLLTHGYSDALARYLNEHGMNAAALRTAYGDEE